MQKVAQALKVQVINWARVGKPKPSRYIQGYKANYKQYRLANALYAATNSKNAPGIYDPDFDRMIREIRPDWFEPVGMRKHRLEREWLVEDAYLGFPKPRNLARHLRLHGKILEKELQTIRPDWFIDPNEERKKAFWLGRRQGILFKLRYGLRVSQPERQFMYLSRQKDRPEYDLRFCEIMEKYGRKGG